MYAPYPASLRLLHWGTALLVAALFAIGWSIDSFEAAATRKALMTAHQSVGLAIVVLTLARIALWRGAGRETEREGPAWMRLSAMAAHAALYLVLIALPVSGWLYTSAKGGSVNFFWAVRLPHLLAADDTLADTLIEVHETIAFGLLALVALHLAAALYHHLALRDGVLARMLPLAARRAG